MPDPFARFLLRGDFADLYFEESTHRFLRWEDGRLDELVQGTSSGVGFRCVRGEETLYGHLDGRAPFSGTWRSGEMRRLSELAGSLSAGLPARRRPMRFRRLPVRRHRLRVPPDAVPLAKKIALLRRADRASRFSPELAQVTLSLGERRKRVLILNSLGEWVEEERNYVVFVAQATAKKDGLLQTGHEVAGGLGGFELLDRALPERVARIAAGRAVKKLRASPVVPGEMPVVISSQAGGTLIHEAVGHALEADSVQQGSSPHFAGRVGKKVAGAKVTVLDDPTRAAGRGSFFYDDEASPSQRTVLIENGILRTYLYDRLTAKKEKRTSNGHGRRESYAHRPIPRMSNTFVAPGKDSPEDIVRSLKRGLLVTRMGGGQVNTAGGDFVFEVEEGFWVEDGRVLRMARGANLLGSAPEVLRSIDRVGSDMGWSVGTCGKDGQNVPVSDGLPTLRVPKLLVGGTKSGKGRA